ncbi:MAG TPA: hypothetical protein VMU27_00140 [Candidatus Paceibacterota bacterium]|nr:hypothetical protein [Candidatus Paceibacterota bacterium]
MVARVVKNKLNWLTQALLLIIGFFTVLLGRAPSIEKNNATISGVNVAFAEVAACDTSSYSGWGSACSCGQCTADGVSSFGVSNSATAADSASSDSCVSGSSCDSSGSSGGGGGDGCACD